MIRAFVRFGKWLDSRFPEKRVVLVSDYENIFKAIRGHNEELSQLRSKLDILERNLAPLVSRLSTVETNAVHKGAVSDVVLAVKAIKDEFSSLKTSLGMSRIGDNDIRAMLNGEPIPEDQTNG